MIWSEILVQAGSTKLEDTHLSWADIERNWTSVVDLIVLHFPCTDRLELLKQGGDLTAFTQYLSEVHELTLKEALDAVDFILLKNDSVLQRASQAA